MRTNMENESHENLVNIAFNLLLEADTRECANTIQALLHSMPTLQHLELYYRLLHKGTFSKEKDIREYIRAQKGLKYVKKGQENLGRRGNIISDLRKANYIIKKPLLRGKKKTHKVEYVVRLPYEPVPEPLPKGQPRKTDSILSRIDTPEAIENMLKNYLYNQEFSSLIVGNLEKDKEAKDHAIPMHKELAKRNNGRLLAIIEELLWDIGLTLEELQLCSIEKKKMNGGKTTK